MKIRSFLIFSGLLIMISCNQIKKKSTAENSPVLADTQKITKYEFSPFFISDSLVLPKDFHVDSSVKFDRLRNTEIQIFLPKYSLLTDFDTQVSSYISGQFSKFIAYLDTLIQEDPSMLISTTSSFIIYPVSIYRDSKLVSYCFIISTDHAGAAHPLTKYYSFNYDLTKKRRIGFFEYFQVKSKQDTAFLKKVINEAINRENISVSKLYDIDFNIVPDGIEFNFDDYEIASYAEGIIKAKVQKKRVHQIVKNNYR